MKGQTKLLIMLTTLTLYSFSSKCTQFKLLYVLLYVLFTGHVGR